MEEVWNVTGVHHVDGQSDPPHAEGLGATTELVVLVTLLVLERVLDHDRVLLLDNLEVLDPNDGAGAPTVKQHRELMDVTADFGGLSPICAIACLQKHSFWMFFGLPGAVSLDMKSLEQLGEGLELLRLCLLGDLGNEGRAETIRLYLKISDFLRRIGENSIYITLNYLERPVIPYSYRHK